MKHNQVINKYRAKSLGTYYNSKDLLVDGLDQKDNLLDLLYEMSSHEVDLNDDGRSFLEQYWGLSNIAEIIMDYENGDGDFTNSFDTKEAIVQWIKYGGEYRLLTDDEDAKQATLNGFFKKYGEVKLGGLVGVNSSGYYISDFNKEKDALKFLANLSKKISYLTDAGCEFFKEFYGLKRLAKAFHEKYPQCSKGSAEKNLEWLINDKSDFIRK